MNVVHGDCPSFRPPAALDRPKLGLSPSARRWSGLCLLAGLVLLAAAFRLPRLAARPMHADEANQALKAADLWQTGNYHYDVADHHGPSLYWLTLPSLWLSGARDLAATTESNYRVVPLVFGIALVGLMLLFADGLGLPAVAVAGVLTAVSPASVYFSRYYIQEMLLLFFTTALMASAWRYVRSRSLAWAIAAGAALGMMHATKETWVLSAAAMLAAAALTLAWSRWHNVSGTLRVPTAGGTRSVPDTWALLAALATAGLVAAAFYTSLGSNPHGLWDSIRAVFQLLASRPRGGRAPPRLVLLPANPFRLPPGPRLLLERRPDRRPGPGGPGCLPEDWLIFRPVAFLAETRTGRKMCPSPSGTRKNAPAIPQPGPAPLPGVLHPAGHAVLRGHSL